MKLKLLLTIAFAITSMLSMAQHSGASYGQVECISVESDGSLTLRVHSLGRNRYDAKDQARKDAIYEVIFKGVKVEGNQMLSRPLLYEVNAEEKYQDFFNGFFADGGKFMEYSSMKDKKAGSSTRKGKGGIQVEKGITIRVLRPQLKKYLIEQNIIKQ